MFSQLNFQYSSGPDRIGYLDFLARGTAVYMLQHGFNPEHNSVYQENKFKHYLDCCFMRQLCFGIGFERNCAVAAGPDIVDFLL